MTYKALVIKTRKQLKTQKNFVDFFLQKQYLHECRPQWVLKIHVNIVLKNYWTSRLRLSRKAPATLSMYFLEKVGYHLQRAVKIEQVVVFKTRGKTKRSLRLKTPGTHIFVVGAVFKELCNYYSAPGELLLCSPPSEHEQFFKIFLYGRLLQRFQQVLCYPRCASSSKTPTIHVQFDSSRGRRLQTLFRGRRLRRTLCSRWCEGRRHLEKRD